jgi:oligosaccharyltransferase complex subunit beta
VDAGKSLILAVPPGPAGPGRAVAAGLGVDPEPPGASVADAVRHAAGADPGSVLAPIVGPAVIVGEGTAGPPARPRPAVLRGAGFTVSPSAVGVWPLVVAPVTGFSTAPPPTNPATPAPAGPALILAAAVQTRGRPGGRALVVGSEDLFDAELGAPGLTVNPSDGGQAMAPANGPLASAAAAWALGDAGRLRASPLRHRLAPGTPAANAASPHPHRSGDAPYRIGDAIQVALDIEKAVVSKSGQVAWVPHDARDVQAEYTMLDPHVRKTLTPPGAPNAPSEDGGFIGNATFSAIIDAPDVYGAFKLTLEYARPGWSFLSESTPAPLRPFRHDEFDRFLPSAYPYYTAALSTMVAFLGVTVVSLYGGTSGA